MQLLFVGGAVTATALTIDAYGYEEEQTWTIELTPEQIGQIRSIEMKGGEVATLKSQVVTGSVFSYNLGHWEQKQPASNE
ncbi:hypothetical protein N9Z44_01095 [Mariniblastus sp.]|nr:hypothetical protein [Mariniblastus sp.]